MTVAEIAYYLGFHDPAYFTRVFTKHAGSRPEASATAPHNEIAADIARGEDDLGGDLRLRIRRWR